MDTSGKIMTAGAVTAVAGMFLIALRQIPGIAITLKPQTKKNKKRRGKNNDWRL